MDFPHRVLFHFRARPYNDRCDERDKLFYLFRQKFRICNAACQHDCIHFAANCNGHRTNVFGNLIGEGVKDKRCFLVPRCNHGFHLTAIVRIQVRHKTAVIGKLIFERLLGVLPREAELYDRIVGKLARARRRERSLTV